MAASLFFGTLGRRFDKFWQLHYFPGCWGDDSTKKAPYIGDRQSAPMFNLSFELRFDCLAGE